MKKLFVTGISGFLGWNLYKEYHTTWDIYGTYFAHSFNVNNAHSFSLNLTDKDQLIAMFERVRPDAVVHLAAYSQPNFCQQNPELSYRLNVEASENLANLSKKYGIPFIFASTDLVFDGTDPAYDENSPINPIMIYGKHKAEAEKKIDSIYADAIICRLPLMLGDSGFVASNGLADMIDAMKQNKPLYLFEDEYRTTVSGLTAVKGMMLCVKKGIRGTIHLGGKESVSRYQMGLTIKEVFKLKEANIIKSKQADVKMAAPRPSDVSLNSEKAFKLGYNPGSFKEEMEEVKKMTELIYS